MARGKTNYKVFVVPIVILGLLILGAWSYNKYIKEPVEKAEGLEDELEEKEEIIDKLNETIQQNLTTTTTVTETKTVTGWTILFFMTTIGLILYIVLKGRGSMGIKKKRHEVIANMRKYAKEKDDLKPTLYKKLAYAQGNYKADVEFPIAIVLFSTSKTWDSFKEPNPHYIYGYMVNRKDTDDVVMDFQGMSIREVKEEIKNVTWGMAWSHFFPYKTKSYEQKYLENLGDSRETIQEAVAIEKAVRELT